MKNRIALLFFLCIFTAGYAHEEPSKTLKEKNEKEIARKKILKSKINTATVWKYVVANGKESVSKNKAFTMGYDNNGYFVFIEAYKNDSLTEKDEYTYSSTGDMLTEIDYSPDGKVIEKNLFAFDAYGRVISGVSKDEKDSVTGLFENFFSKDRKCIEFVKYKSKDSIEYKLIYTYAEDFDKYDYTEALKYDALAKLLMKVKKSYNTDGLQTKKSIFDSEEKLQYYFNYEYDKSGNMTVATKTLADGTVEWTDHYSYDANGNCTELKSYDKNNILQSHLVYEFEYYKS